MKPMLYEVMNAKVGRVSRFTDCVGQFYLSTEPRPQLRAISLASLVCNGVDLAALHRGRLVLRWVTVCKRTNHVTNRPTSVCFSVHDKITHNRF